MPSREIKPYKEIAKDLNIDDTAAVMDMTCAILKNLGGRPFIYPNNEAGLKSFIENSQGYFTYVQNANNKLEEKQQIIPDVEGYCLWLGISRTTLKNYVDRGGEWAAVIDLFKNAIGNAKKQLILKGRIPAVIGIFDLTNNHSYVNSTEFKLETRATESKASDIELENQARAAGLIWDETVKEWVPEG